MGSMFLREYRTVGLPAYEPRSSDTEERGEVRLGCCNCAICAAMKGSLDGAKPPGSRLGATECRLCCSWYGGK